MIRRKIRAPGARLDLGGPNPAQDLPRVCIVTPVFNGVRYIDQTIASVLTQSGEFALHYHVQDGGSTDGTQQAVRRWMRRHRLGLLPKSCRGVVFTLASEPDGGMYDAVNRGFAAALPPGDDVIMGWIAADDAIAPGAFATLTSLASNFPEVRLFGGRMALMDEHGSVTAIDTIRPFSRRAMSAGLYDGRDGRPFVMQEGTFWCADLWRAVGGLDTSFSLAGDWDLWRRMAARASYVSVDTALGFHRRRPGQLSQQIERYYREVDAKLDQTIAYGETATADRAAIQAGAAAAETQTTLRSEYERVAAEQERLLSDPASFRVSGHAATVLRFDLNRQAWCKIDAFGAPMLETEVVDEDSSVRQQPVAPLSGFGTLGDPRPDLGIHTRIRWLLEPQALGEVVLARDGTYAIVLRYRAWQRNMAASFTVDGRLVARRAMPGFGPEREVEVRVAAPLRAGRRRIAFHVEHGDQSAGFFILIGWTVQEIKGSPRPTPGEGGDPPTSAVQREGEWPRVSAIVVLDDDAALAAATLRSLMQQTYPNLQVLLAGRHSASALIGERVDLAGVDAVLSVSDLSFPSVVRAASRRIEGEILWIMAAGDRVAAGALKAAVSAFDGGCKAVLGLLLVETAAQGADAQFLPGSRDLWAGRALRRWRGPEEPSTSVVQEGEIERLGRPLLHLGRRGSSPPPRPPLEGVLAVLVTDGAAAADLDAGYALANDLRILGATVTTTGSREPVEALYGRRRPRKTLLVGEPEAAGSRALLAEAARRGWPAAVLDTTARPDGEGAHIPATDTTLFRPGDQFRARMLLGLPLDAYLVVVAGPNAAALAAFALSGGLPSRAQGLIIITTRLLPSAERQSVVCWDFGRFASGRALALQASDLMLADEEVGALELAEADQSGVPVLLVDVGAGAAAGGLKDRPNAASGAGRAGGPPLPRAPRERRSPIGGALALLTRLPAETLSSLDPPLEDGIGLLAPVEACGADNPMTPEWRMIGSALTEPALLVRAPYAGEFICQLFTGDGWSRQDVLCVNGEAHEDGPLVVGEDEVRFVMLLDKGINRLALTSSQRSRLWLSSVQEVALWPARRTAADVAPDGLLTIDQGFEDREPADLASLLPAPFNRAVDRHNLLWLASSFDGVRNFAIRLRNPFPEQHLTVRLGGQVVCSADARPRTADLTILYGRGRFVRGHNPIVISPRSTGTDGLGRDLAFYLEEVSFFVDLPAATDLVCWDESTGFGELEAPVVSQDLLEPFRWMQSGRASVVLERLKAESVRIALHVRFLGPRQVVVVRANGVEVASEIVEGQDLRVRRLINATTGLSGGRNEISVEIDRPGATSAEGRDLYMLLERLEIEPVGPASSRD